MKFKSSLLILGLLNLALCFVSPCMAKEKSFSNSTLRYGDTIKITVYRLTEFDSIVRVDSKGNISFPLGGPIQVAGLETHELANLIEKRLRENQISDPHVDVFVNEWAPRQVYAMGEVQNANQAILLPTSGNLTVIQALTILGTKESALLTQVAILRKVKGKTQRIAVPLKKIYSDLSAQAELMEDPDFILRPDDVIVVPKALPVTITGMINSPGRYFIDTLNPPTISEMITQAGGLNEDANVEQIILIRRDPTTKKPTVSSICYADILKGNIKQDITLFPGATLIVNPSKQIFVSGSVKSSGPLKLLPGQSITASQAIAMSGGFTTVAKKSAVILIREGKIYTINLSNAFNDEDNLKNDWSLKAGDMIFVKESLW